jgi:dipeptidyl aminopeptidase/acylaminoacyl peptidase
VKRIQGFSCCAAAATLAVVFASRALAAAPPVETYGQLPTVEMMRLSPGGDKIAYVTVAGSDRKLHVIDADGKVLHEVDCADIKLRRLDWADDDHVALSASVTMRLNHYSDAAGEFLAVVTLNVPQHRLAVIFSNQSEVMPLVFGAYGFSAADGHAYGYFGGIRNADLHTTGIGFVNLYRVDLDTGERYMAARGGFKSESWLIDPATGGKIATALNDEHSGEWRIEASDKVVARGRADYGPARVLGLGRADGSLLIAEPTDGDDAIREVRLDGGGASDVKDGGTIADFLLDRRSARWIGTTRDSSEQDTHFLDPADEARWRTALAVVGDDRASLVSYSDRLSRVIAFTEGDKDSGTYWLVDTQAKTARQVGRAYPDIPADQVGPVSEIDWKAGDGLTVHGVVTLPPGKPAHALPLVVLPHGGPQSRDYAQFNWWAQAFAARGYAVLQPNYRGSAGFGDAYVKAGYGEWGGKMQTDVSDGMAMLAGKGVIDPRRACIVGGSYGGYAALAGVTVQQGLYRCAVSWGGVTDLPAMLLTEYRASGSSKSDATRYWRRFMGADGPGKRDLNAVSPAKLAARADAPILLMYGHDDTVVKPTQSLEMADALKKAGKPYELQVMPGEDHWLSRGATRLAMLRAAVAFVEKHNPAD